MVMMEERQADSAGPQNTENANLRDDVAETSPPLHLKVAYGLRLHDVSIPCQATFGDLKPVLECLTGLHPQAQRLLFVGKEREDSEILQSAGVKEKSKLILVEDPASKERKWEEAQRNERIAKACQAVEHVRGEVDKIVGQVTSLEATVTSRTWVSKNEFTLLSELLMRQLLKLDSIEAEGEAKLLRKSEVQRIQKFTDVVDRLKAQNDEPLHSGTVVTTQWETFDNSVSSIPSTTPTNMTTDWEHFD